MRGGVVHASRSATDISRGREHDGAEDRHDDREREVEPADDDQPTAASPAPAARPAAQLPLQPRPEHVVVDQAARRTRSATSTDLTISVRSKSVSSATRLKPPCSSVSQSPERIATAHRAPAERPPAPPERPHRRRARLALELADRGHADEDEHHRAADPDAGREQVDDAKHRRARSGQAIRFGRRAHGHPLASSPWTPSCRSSSISLGVFLFVGGSLTATVLRARGDPAGAAVRAGAPAAHGPADRPDRRGRLRAHDRRRVLARRAPRPRSRRDLALRDLRADRSGCWWSARSPGAPTGAPASWPSELAADGDRPTPELTARLRDPLVLGLDASMLLATLAIVALMVWKPA